MSGVLWDHYGPPPGFCWDLICNDAPIMDPSGLVLIIITLSFLSTLLFQMMTIIIIIFSVAGLESNVANLTRQFVERVKNQAKHYRDRDFED